MNDYTLLVSDIQREQEKVKRSIKDAAKKGQKDVCVILAKEMIQSKRAVTKLYASKAHMNSVLLSMKNQLGEFGITEAGSLDRGKFNVISSKILYRHQYNSLLLYQLNVLLGNVSEGNEFVLFQLYCV